jgi:hypothetical protein
MQNQHIFESDLLSPAEAAQLLGVSRSFLQKDRLRDIPKIPFIKMGHKTIRYHIDDLIEFIKRQKKGRKS